MKRPVVVRACAFAAAALAALWLGGFIWFAHDAVQVPPVPPVADGIVALTGGADRVATAILLLRDGRGRLLLISGVGPGAEMAKPGGGMPPTRRKTPRRPPTGRARTVCTR
jgi:hypothetical protein